MSAWVNRSELGIASEEGDVGEGRGPEQPDGGDKGAHGGVTEGGRMFDAANGNTVDAVAGEVTQDVLPPPHRDDGAEDLR